MGITVKKTGTEFELRDGTELKIRLCVDHVRGTIDVMANHGGNFTFLGTKPEMAERIGLLISEAGKVAENEFDQEEDRVKP